MAPSAKLTLVEHVAELRQRLLKSLAALAALSLLCYTRHDALYDFMAKPVGGLVFTRPTEAMMVMLKISFLGGLVLALPVLLYQAWAYFAPALGPARSRLLAACLGLGWLLFLLGLGFGLAVLPQTMRFLLGFARPDLTPMISAEKYVSFALLTSFGCGLVFQAPLAAFFLARVGLLTRRGLLRHWRVAVLGILVLAALICPAPDLFTWMVVSVPLFLLYLASLWVAGWAAPGGGAEAGEDPEIRRA